MAKTAGGADTDRFDGVTTNNLGDVFVSGLIRGTSNFDAIQHVESNQYQFYPILAKINFSNLITIDFNTENIVLYPNPSNDYIYIQNSTNYSKAEIYSVSGQKVADFQINSAPISIKELAIGTYFIKIDGNKVLKFIKN